MIDAKKIFSGNIAHIENVDDDFYAPHLKGQSPGLCLVYCSDSREDIHIISDIKPQMGEIFTIKNAGNMIDGSLSTIGSITYCLAHLRTKELLIVGHTGCGAIAAVFKNYHKDKKAIADHILYLENVKKITLSTISRIAGKAVTEQDILSSEKYLAMASEINIDYQCEFARQILKSQQIEGINIFGAMHDLHGIYGRKNGMLFMVYGSSDVSIDTAQKSRLVSYGKNKTIGDVIKELSISFYSG